MSTELSQQSEAQETKYTLAQLLTSEKFSRKLVEIMGSEENVKRFVQVGLQCLNRQPKLAECKQSTVFDCLLKLSQLGLEPDGYHAHLIPFNNRVKQATGPDKWELQCQLIVDYKGLINVVRRNPKVTVFKGGIIKVQDQFKFREGSDRVFSHEPVFPKPGVKLENPIALVYAFIKWINGDWDVDIMTVDEVERIRDRSRAKDSGPWVTDWAEMAMKTAIRHLSKRLELTYEERAIITADDDQFAYGNPFESAQAPKLTYTKPEFLSGSEVSPDDRESDSTSMGRGPEQGVKQARRRSDQRGKAEVQEAVEQVGKGQRDNVNAGKAAESSKTGKTVQAGGEVVQQAEPEYKYGPGDDERRDAVVSDRGPQEPDSKASETVTAPDIGVSAAAQDANAEERQRAAANLAKLVKNIQRDKIDEAKVVQVLLSFDRDVGFAAESGKVSDLPDLAVEACVRNWGSILFNLKKNYPL